MEGDSLQGLRADPTAVQSLIIIPGAAGPREEIMPFWQAALGYVPRHDNPDAVYVPYDQVAPRVEAALAAGGRMVRDESAPAAEGRD